MAFGKCVTKPQVGVYTPLDSKKSGCRLGKAAGRNSAAANAPQPQQSMSRTDTNSWDNNSNADALCGARLVLEYHGIAKHILSELPTIQLYKSF